MKVDLHQIETRFAALRAQQPRRERQLLADLVENGQRQSLIVVQEHAERFTLIDGHKRLRAATKLGWAQAEVLVWDLSPQDALVYERLQRDQNCDSPIEQGWLLRELAEAYGMSLQTLADRFGKSKSWVSRRLALVEVLPAQIAHAVATGSLSASVAEKHLVPLARANAGEAEQVAQALAGKSLNVRDAGAVVAAYASADAAGRERLLADPKLYLRALDASRAPTEPSPDANSPAAALRANLIRVTAHIGRCQQTLLEQGAHLDDDPRQQLHDLITGVMLATEQLITIAAKEIGYARPEHPNRHPQAA